MFRRNSIFLNFSNLFMLNTRHFVVALSFESIKINYYVSSVLFSCVTKRNWITKKKRKNCFFFFNLRRVNINVNVNSSSKNGLYVANPSIWIPRIFWLNWGFARKFQRIYTWVAKCLRCLVCLTQLMMRSRLLLFHLYTCGYAPASRHSNQLLVLLMVLNAVGAAAAAVALFHLYVTVIYIYTFSSRYAWFCFLKSSEPHKNSFDINFDSSDTDTLIDIIFIIFIYIISCTCSISNC